MELTAGSELSNSELCFDFMQGLPTKIQTKLERPDDWRLPAMMSRAVALDNIYNSWEPKSNIVRSVTLRKLFQTFNRTWAADGRDTPVVTRQQAEAEELERQQKLRERGAEGGTKRVGEGCKDGQVPEKMAPDGQGA